MTRPDRGGGLDGIVVLAKPAGPTSHDVVGIVRRLTGTRRVGHGGTLDPFASGVLPVFLGLGTRMVEYHMGDGKSYRATVCFGAGSTTDDRDGELTPSGAPAPTREQVLAALPAFRGRIEQRPPAYSALKVAGRRAYELAREGVAPELAPRQVTIDRLELIAWDDSDPERPTATLEVDCGAGTYIRALARDLGERLGCGGYLGALVRTASGPFTLQRAHSLDEFRAAAAAGGRRLARLILPIDAGLEGIPTVTLDPSELVAIARGQPVRPGRRPGVEQGTVLRLLGPDGALAGMATWRGGRLAPDKVFVGVRGPEAPGRANRHDAREERDGREVHDDRRAADRPRAAEPEPASERRNALVDPPVRLSLPADCLITIAGVDGLRADLGRLYLAVGVFDGLHRGHLYLLRNLRRAAKAAGARPAVITFDAHPEEVVLGVAPSLLCDPAERLVRIAAAGVEVVVVQHFDQALRETAYQDFVAAIQAHVEVAGFLMTPDAAFGHGRRGTPEALAELGEQAGFVVTTVEPFLVNGRQVRSSDIRSAIEQGRLEDARRLLGRPLSVVGHALPSGDPASVPVGFDVPVALPPPGRYEALVGPAWHPGQRPEPATRLAQAVISGDPRRLALALDGPPPDDLVRAVLGERLDGD